LVSGTDLIGENLPADLETGPASNAGRNIFQEKGKA
jgi:hypothetical protein